MVGRLKKKVCVFSIPVEHLPNAEDDECHVSQLSGYKCFHCCHNIRHHKLNYYVTIGKLCERCICFPVLSELCLTLYKEGKQLVGTIKEVYSSLITVHCLISVWMALEKYS